MYQTPMNSQKSRLIKTKKDRKQSEDEDADEHENEIGARNREKHKRTQRNNFFCAFFLFQYQPGEAPPQVDLSF
jgi:hypothetical protein